MKKLKNMKRFGSNVSIIKEIERRKRVYSLWIFVALFTAISSVQGQSSEPLFPETPGLVSYTHRESFKESVPKTLDTIQDLGITDMEFSSLFGQTAESLRKLLDERNIKCTSFGVGYDDLVDDTDEVARKAKVLGASFVRVAWIPHEGTFDIKDAKKAVKDFNRSGKLLKEKHGLTFCYHNHGYEFRPYEDGTFFDYLMEHTDPKYVSFEMDILWVAHPGKDPVDLLEKYSERFKLMHLKDLRKGVVGDFTGKTPKENDVVLGQGQINIPAVLKAAKRAGIQHYYIEDESKLKSEQVPRTMAYLKGLEE